MYTDTLLYKSREAGQFSKSNTEKKIRTRHKIGGITRARGDSYPINRDKRRTFIGLHPVLFQLPQPYLILDSDRNQWFLNEKAAAGRPISDPEEGAHVVQQVDCMRRVADGNTHVLPHLRVRVRGQVTDDLSPVCTLLSVKGP